MAGNLSQWWYSSITTSMCEMSFLHIPTGLKMIALQYAIAIINIPIAFFGAMANGFVIMAYYRIPRPRSIQNTIFLLLAITDFSVTALVEPMYVTAIFSSLLGKHNCLLWDINATLSKLFVGLSLVTGAILSLQSYITLAYPYHWRGMLTKSRFSVMIVFSWLLISILALALSLREKALKYAHLAILCLTIIIVIFTWCWTYRLVGRHRKAIETSQIPSTSRIVSRRKIPRSTITAFAIIVSLLGCYLLAFCFLLFKEFIASTLSLDEFNILWSLSRTLMYLNSLLNPCLVFWRSTPFRETVENVFN